MRYKLAIFDMDGTILDTLDDLKNSTNAAMEHFGYPTRSLEEVRQFVGNGMEKLIRRAVPDDTGDDDILTCLEYFKKHYAIHSRECTRPYDGILQLLSRLKAEGIKVAVISNKGDFAVQELCSFYFPGVFDFAAGERVGIRRKPAPDAVFSTLETLQCSAEEAIYIGDSEVDYETAVNAGLDCILVEWGFRSVEMLSKLGAKYLAEKTEDIADILLTEEGSKKQS